MQRLLAMLLFGWIGFSMLGNAQPVVNIGSDTTLCQTNLTLDAGNTGATFLWSTGETTQTIQVSGSGTYWVDVTNSGTTRDSINITFVDIPNTPSVPANTDVCSGINTITTTGNATKYIWYDAASGGNIIHTGTSIDIGVSSDTTVWVQGYNLFTQSGYSDIAPASTDYRNIEGRGLLFDVHEPITLQDVTVYVDPANLPAEATIELWDASNNVIGSQTVTFSSGGAQIAALGFDIPTGNDYKLILGDVASGRFNLEIYASYAASPFPFVHDELTIQEGYSVDRVYNYFYNWTINKLGCASARAAASLTLQPTPSVDLGSDTSFCGASYFLDATYSGTGTHTYLWNTGATTPSINFSNNGDSLLWVTITTNGICQASDSVLVGLSPLPTFIEAQEDTTVCEGPIQLTVDGDADLYLWYEDNAYSNILGAGTVLDYMASIDDTVWVKSFNLLQKNDYGRLAPSPADYRDLDARGIEFDVYENIVLNSVVVYVDPANFPASGVVSLKDNTGTVLESKTITASNSGAQTIDLDFFIPPGNDYYLEMTDVTSGRFSLEVFASYAASPFPFNYDEISITQGLPVDRVYPYFYDWSISNLGCTIAGDSTKIDVVPAPNVHLGSDTIVCGNDLVLDATYSGTATPTYSWSTGDNTPTTTITSTQNVGVTVTTDGLCSDSSNIQVSIAPDLTISTTDTSLCEGTIPLIVNGDADGYIWYEDANLNTLFSGGDTINYIAAQDDTLWVRGYHLFNQTGYAEIAPNSTDYRALDDRGLLFDVYDNITLESVDLYVNPALLPASAIIELKNSSGTVIGSQTVSFAAGGMQTATLNFFIEAGNDYTLELAEVISGEFNLEIYGSFAASPFPFTHNELKIKQGTPLDRVYNYFYNWSIATLGCPSVVDSAIIEVLTTPSVALPNDTIVCGTSLTLDATNSGNVTYEWSNGTNSNTLTVTQSGSVGVTVTGDGVCRDSSFTFVTIAPDLTILTTDIALCAQDTFLMVAGDADEYIWYEDANLNTILTGGDTIPYAASVDDTLWIQGYHLFDQTGYAEVTPNSTDYRTLNERGILFDVYTNITLKSVDLYVNPAELPASAVVELKNSAGTVINSQPITFVAGGAQTAQLNFFIETGTDYRLELNDISSGEFNLEIYTDLASSPFPFNYNEISIKQGYPIDRIYNYFYNWSIATLGCPSVVDSSIIEVYTTPSVEFPADTAICGSSFVLDAFYPGNVTYLWNDGSTNSSFTATQSNTVSVVVTGDGICSDSASVDLFFKEKPITTDILTPDTTICLGDILVELSPNGAENYLWYEENNLVGVGPSISIPVEDSIAIIAYGANAIPLEEPIAELDMTSTNQFYFFNEFRGLVFDVYEPLILNSFDVYTKSDSFEAIIELRDAGQIILKRDTVEFNSAGLHTINWDISINQGNNYYLVIRMISGEIYYLSPFSYPITTDLVSIKTGWRSDQNDFINVYYHFYNWKVSTYSCLSDPDTVEIGTLPTPSISWPEDTIICDASVIFDVAEPNADYLWHSGATNSSIELSEDSTIHVNVTIGDCSDSDTMSVLLTNPPTTITTTNDTSICAGEITLYANSDGFAYGWYTDSLSNTPFAFVDSVTLDIQDTTTVWVEGLNFILSPATYGYVVSSPPASGYETIVGSGNTERGLEFTTNSIFSIEEVSVYVAGAAVTATVRLYNEFGIELYNQPVSLTNIGENIIPLDWILEANNRYQIILDDVAGGDLYVAPIGTVNYPMIFEQFTIEQGISASLIGPDTYPYFCNWKISSPSCATERKPIHIAITPSATLTMVNDTATCSASAITVDAINAPLASYGYNWSTGDTTNAITVSSTGYYGVTVTNDGICPSAKDIYVQFLNSATPVNVSDTTICASGVIDLQEDPSDEIHLWYNDNMATNPIYLSAPYSTFVEDTTRFYTQKAPKATTRLGDQINPNFDKPQNYFDFAIPHVFDVFEYTRLDSVAVYVDQAPASFEVLLKDNVGNVLESKTVTIHQAQQKQFIELGFILAPESGYQLTFSNSNAGFLVNPFQTYPLTSNAGVVVLTGSSDPSTVWEYFYDWHFSYAFEDCRSALDSFDVNIKSPLNLPDYVYTCESVQFDVTNGSAINYNWSHGPSTPLVTITEAGTYSVTLSDGGNCVNSDTVVVEQPIEIGLPTNFVACDGILTTNYSDSSGTTFNWSTGENTPSITIPATGTYGLSLTTSAGCFLAETTTINQIEQAPPINLGTNRFVCEGDTLYAGISGGIGVTFEWNTGSTDSFVVVDQAGIYELEATSSNGCVGYDAVNLQFTAPPEADFTIFVSNLSVGLVNSSTGGTQYQWFFGDGDSTQLSPTASVSHPYADSGCYKITLITVNDCYSDTAIQNAGVGVDTPCVPTSIIPIAQPINAPVITLAPNPNAGQFVLSASEAFTESVQIEVYNLQGKRIYNRIWPAGIAHQAMALPEFAKGMYMIRLIHPKWQQTLKWIRQ